MESLVSFPRRLIKGSAGLAKLPEVGRLSTNGLEILGVRQREAETGRSSFKNLVRSVRPLSDHLMVDGGNHGKLVLRARSGLHNSH